MHSVDLTASRNMPEFVLGVDGGTESIRAGVYSPDGTLVAAASSPYPTAYPAPGRAEQNPEDWYRCLGEAVRGAVEASGVDPADIKGVVCAHGQLVVMCMCAPMGSWW
jgi:sugar (pentulose or hexulose) kinase